jgi:hypothetical protein
MVASWFTPPTRRRRPDNILRCYRERHHDEARCHSCLLSRRHDNWRVGLVPKFPDVICFSHLRWNFVFQRPQHLLTRCAREARVFFIEEPVYGSGRPRLDLTPDASGVTVAVPHLPDAVVADGIPALLRQMLDDLVRDHHIQAAVRWYYTPMALEYSKHLAAAAVVYDCMDELSGFAGAPSGLVAAERALFASADVVFTGGHALFEAKCRLHPNIHAVPSSVEVTHFGQARGAVPVPPDQASIPSPRAGFFGVIDERLDTALLQAAADLRPEWQFVMVGPVVKIDQAVLPTARNLHYLGPKSYADLPRYIAGWDVALLPFARNAATRFISPTKTPEYLAAGRAVVSTSIRDVVRPYGDLGLARIADDPAAFVAAMDEALRDDPVARTTAADAFLAHTSWDATWAAMRARILEAVRIHTNPLRAHRAVPREPQMDRSGTPASA